MHEPITDGDLRDALRRHARLIEEDAAEVLAIGKHLGLQRQERAAGIDEVDARQPVLQRDLLGAQVLLHRHRKVGAAFDGGVVGDDHHLAARHPADAGHDAGARRLVVVHVGRRRAAEQLEEGRAGIEQAVDALAHRAACPGPRCRSIVFRAAAFARARSALAQLGDQLLHSVAIGLENRVGGVDAVSRGSIGCPDVVSARFSASVTIRSSRS